ncbi:MAG TPA: tetratricopeptide repeat protein, partial [Rhodothermales bacterium]|nr:tetratricopeptide repeat protein [Rhodothermales bacterium]
MSIQVTAYRVFIASPGGLLEDRKLVKEILREYNETEGIDRGVQFVAVDWEGNLGGVGRPQALINEQVRECDYFVCLFHDRWGMSPGADGVEKYPRYSSGTEEEFYVALDAYRDYACAMKQLVVCFKAVEPEKMANPDRQLQKVLRFKKKLETERLVLFRTFDEARALERILRQNLGQWARDHAAGHPVNRVDAVEPAEHLASPLETAGIQSLNASAERPAPNEEDLDQARKLANEGKLVEAEALYAQASIKGDDPRASIQYGWFLSRVGRLAQAEAMFEHALEQGTTSGDQAMIARALRNRGNVLGTRGDLDGAEEMYEKALEIDERLGRSEGMASDYMGLGNVLYTRGDLGGAGGMY